MKLIIFKKSFILAVAAIIAVGATIGICCGLATKPANAASEKVIVIDAGHGGIDAGVRGITTDTKESDINLSVAKKLKSCFTDAGFSVVLTRNNNGGLYGLSTSGFKMRDMKKRKEIIQTAKADMVISIHQNFCPIPTKRGSTVFFDKSSESGKLLAGFIQTELNTLNDGVKPNEALAGDYYMLKCTDNPSVIVEFGFLSNADDEKNLLSENYQERLAYAIFKGAVSYYC